MRGLRAGADTPDGRGKVGAQVLAYVTKNRSSAGAALALTMLSVQFAVIAWSPSSLPVRVVLPATVALVPVALWPLRGHAGVWVMFVGMAANLAVILANGGLMPIERATVVQAVGAERAGAHAPGSWITGSKDVLVRDGDGRLVALGDSIVLRLGPRGLAASPGDVVVWAGLALLIAEAAWGWERSRWRVSRRIGDGSAPARAEGGASTPQ